MGFGGGALQPTQQAILRQTFPPEEQGIAMAMFSMVIMIGPAIGPVLGGFITDNYSWPWIFYINLPVGILIGIMMTLQNVHEPRRRARRQPRARRDRAQEPRHRRHRADGRRRRRAAVPVRRGLAGRLVRLDGDPDRGVRRGGRPDRLRHPRAHGEGAGRQLADVQGHDVRVGDDRLVRHVRHADGEHVLVTGIRAGRVSCTTPRRCRVSC